MTDSSTQLPDDPIDEAELPHSQLRPSAGEEALIASGAEVVGDSEIDDEDTIAEGDDAR